jgi:uncharacterized Zn finger protein
MPYKDKDRYQSEEYKEYQRNYQRGWYKRHKTKRLALIYQRKAVINEYIKDIRKQLRCADCGEQHPAALHFHHLHSEDKLFSLGDAVQKGYSLNKIKEEINKCIILCANCHAIRHYNMRTKKQTSSGLVGEFEKLNTFFDISLEEEDVYKKWFGDSGDIEQEAIAYHRYFGNSQNSEPA